MRAQLSVGSRLSLIVAAALAVTGPLLYLAWPSTATWWIGALLVVPLLALAVLRQGNEKPSTDPSGEAPYAPPAEHIGGIL